MSTLRKRVSTYFRQLSFHQENNDIHENSIVLKYLQGSSNFNNEEPRVFYGKKPEELPNYRIANYNTGNEVLCSVSGPGTGLAAVRKRERHLEIPDSDALDFIDVENPVLSNSAIQKKVVSASSTSPTCPKKLDNRKMIISVAGKKYGVENEDKKITKIDREFYRTSLGEESIKGIDDNVDETVEIVKAEGDKKGTDQEKTLNSLKITRKNREQEEHFKRNHRRRRGQTGNRTHSSPMSSLNFRWNSKCDNVAFAVSDTLYDCDGITKKRYGSPIADCYGLIGRKDSFLLAVADGVNWGEKAAIAARSAIHGSLRYLNETIFQDTSLFDEQVPAGGKHADKAENSMNLMKNTSEIFVSILRSFKCAHDLILENDGMLTTLTVAVVLPLEEEPDELNVERSVKLQKQKGVTEKRKFVCCVCNVGDTLAYAFSSRDGLRELTRGSHDIMENRDVRDALGALGPVDGQNPELANLTLSVTVLEASDLLLLASDGLTDNFDPEVCRYTAKKRNPERKDCSARKRSENAELEDRTAENLMDDPLKAHFAEMNKIPEKNVEISRKTAAFSRSKTALDFRRKFIERNDQGLPYVSPLQRYEIQLRLLDDAIRRNAATPKTVCDVLLRHVYEITEQKRRLVEEETAKRRPRRDALEKCAAKPGKLDHVTIVVCRIQGISQN